LLTRIGPAAASRPLCLVKVPTALVRVVSELTEQPELALFLFFRRDLLAAKRRHVSGLPQPKRQRTDLPLFSGARHAAQPRRSL